MKKKMIFLIGFLLIVSANGQFVFGDDDCFFKISNNTNRYWLINIDNICVGAISPFTSQQIKILCPTKRFQVELRGISSDRGHGQRRFFWPEDLKDNKFIWQVE